MITVMTRADYSDDECNMKRWSSACQQGPKGAHPNPTLFSTFDGDHDDDDDGESNDDDKDIGHDDGGVDNTPWRQSQLLLVIKAMVELEPK